MLSIRPMTEADIPLGMRLKELAGWNQTEADWRRHLAIEPAGCFVGCYDGTPAATIATTVFGRDASSDKVPSERSAWIAMVLTDPNFRRRGLANALLGHGIAYAESHGASTIWLDATEMGRPVYEKLGFGTTYTLTRYRGIARPIDRSDETVRLRLMSREDLAGGEVDDLDLAATGADRLKLLTALRDELPEFALMGMPDGAEVTSVLGFTLARRGCRATQLGPVIARTERVGRGLFAAALAQCAGEELLVDVPDGNRAAIEVLTAGGLKPERSFYRMLRKSVAGEAVYAAVDPALWASAGPEFG